jgi:hypothetical protein
MFVLNANQDKVYTIQAVLSVILIALEDAQLKDITNVMGMNHRIVNRDLFMISQNSYVDL